MPANLYGPFDNFDLTSSHVLPALIRKLHEAKLNMAKEVELWGTGTPLREFLHTDDLASACTFLLEKYDGDAPINIGWGPNLMALRENYLIHAKSILLAGSHQSALPKELNQLISGIY